MQITVLRAFFLVLISLCLGFSPSYAQNTINESPPKALQDLKLPIYSWTTNVTQPKAIVIGFHGGCLHGRSYKTLATNLAERNYMFVSMDMRGFGQWYFNDFGDKKDRTFNYDHTMEDFKTVTERLRLAYPNVPIFFIGESLGANLSAALTYNNPGICDGIIMVSPYTRPKLFLSARMLVSLVQVLTNPAHKINLSDYLDDRLSNRADRIAEYMDDPLSRDHQSIRELYKSFKINIHGKHVATKINEEIPLLMVVGAQDKLSCATSDVKLYRKFDVLDKQLVVNPLSGHLMIETASIDRSTVEVISNWLNRHSAIQGLALRKRHEVSSL